MLAVKLEGDAYPGVAWRSLTWIYDNKRTCGVDFQVVETTYGYRGLLILHAGRMNAVWTLRRGPWRWLYRRWARCR